MSQYSRLAPFAICSALVTASAVGGCLGHEAQPGQATGAGATGGSSPTGVGGSATGGSTTGGTGGSSTGGSTTGGSAGSGTMGCNTVTEWVKPVDTTAPACEKVACGAGTLKITLAGHDMMPGYTEDPGVAAQVKSASDSLDIAGKMAQMQGIPVGDRDFDDIERSPDAGDIRGYNYRDAGRGVNLDAGQPNNRPSKGNDFATVFPTESVRAASWDLDLEWRVGEAMGDETAGSLNNMLLAPCMNIIRHPYWGRTQETYSEDNYHTGRMASALTAGIQQHVVACAKHFAANNVERARKDQNAIMNEQTLREIYSSHFDMVINDGGIGCIMASYNLINKVKSTQNHHLLTEILRGDMRYQGLVISDWWAMPGDQDAYKITDNAVLTSTAAEAVKAGLDIEVPWTIYFSHLPDAIPSLLSEDDIKLAAERILRQKFRFKSAKTSDQWSLKVANGGTLVSSLNAGGGDSIDSPVHQALAEETEIKSAVLLTNGDEGAPVLPLKDKVNIAVIGALVPFELISTTVPKSCPDPKAKTCTFNFATEPALGDRGSSRVNGDPATVVGPFAGIQTVGALHGATTVTNGNDAAAAASADAVVVVVGLTPGDEGEEYAIPAGGDRATLDLPADQNALVTSVLALDKPTVIIIEAGSIVNVPWINHPNRKQATIFAGYPGHKGGTALAKLIFNDGGANFSGKMPMAWPKQEDLPEFLTGGAGSIETEMGYYFGYRYYDDQERQGSAKTLVFPFGHGMSYTSFKYSNLQVPCSSVAKDGVVYATVDIENTGNMAGEETAMLFVYPPAPTGNGDRPVKELKSFMKASIPAGETRRVTLPIRIQDLRRWQGDKAGSWVIDSGTYTVKVGKNGDNTVLNALTDTLTIGG